MTVLTEPHTGEIPRPDLGDRTTVIRPMPAVPTADPDGVTTRLKPPTVLVPIVPRRPPLNPNQPTGLVEAPAFMPTGAELAVHARGCRTIVPNDEDFTTAPAAPPPPLPTPPPAPKPASDQGAAQPVGPLERIADLYSPPLQAYRPVEQEYMGKHRPRPGLIARIVARLGRMRGMR